MKAHLKNEARHSFFQGKTLVQVAEAIGISKSTAERWSREEQWVEQRALFEYEARDKYIRENYRAYYMNTTSAANLAFRVMTEALAERQLMSQGKLAKRRMKFSNREMMNAIKSYCALQPLLNDLEAYKRTLKLG